MAADDKQGSWWQTVPGIITGLATLLGTLTALIIAVNNLWVQHHPPMTPTASSTLSAMPVAPRATLPIVTGVRLKDAEELLRELGFTHVGSRRRSSTAVPGTVIEEFPNPGTIVPLDQHVILVVAAPPSLPTKP